MKYCSHCGNEVDEKAVICPKCGVSQKEKKEKKPIFKRWWFWVIVGVLAIAIIGGSSGNDDTQNDTDKSSVTNNVSNVETKPTVVYEKVDLKTLMDDLKANALKAEKTYQNKYVEVTGKISNFDSDGKYISIEPVDADAWNLDTAMCNIQNDEQRDYLLEKVIGDEVTVKGKITSIGEILGYTIKIDSVQ